MNSVDGTTVLDMFECWSQRAPDAVALQDRVGSLRYGELASRSTELAVRLRAGVVGPEDVVGLCFGRSKEFVVAALAILKAGAAYMPLPSDYPQARNARAILDADCGLVLASAETRSLVPKGPQVLALPEILTRVPASPLATIHPRQLAYVIFTSGSTGRPKGVLIEHAGLANLVRAQIAEFNIDHRSRVLQFAPTAFDASVSEVFTALCAGATLYVADEAQRAKNPFDLIASERISVVTLPPSILSELPATDLPDLKTLVSAGEACSREIVAKWSASGRVFINAYGPTEITVCATMGRCYPDKEPTLGSPIANVSAYALDSNLDGVLEGADAELVVGGRGVARGYANDPRNTALRFVPDPFGSSGSRMYRTGDSVRQSPKGEFEFRGRLDSQVKVRGHRIELGEIEAALNAEAAVSKTCVVAATLAGQTRLACFVLPRDDDQAISLEALRSRLAGAVPAYMIPDAFWTVSAWPKTSSDKIDRAALAAEAGRRWTEDSHGTAHAKTALEAKILAIWRGIFPHDEFGVDADFFALGGNSIKAMHLFSTIEIECESSVDTALFLQNPTVQGMCESFGYPAEEAGLVALRRSGNESPLFVFPPVHGNVQCYLGLTRHLRSSCPVYGVEPPGRDGRDPVIDSMEELALDSLRRIRFRQPRGPYRLFGWSMGGAVAFACARLLEEQKEEISFLGLLEATVPVQRHNDAARLRTRSYSLAFVGFWYLRTLSMSLGMPSQVRLEEFEKCSEPEILAEVRAQSISLGSVPENATMEMVGHLLQVFRGTLYAFHHYSPGRLLHQGAIDMRTTGGHPAFDPEKIVVVGEWDAFNKRNPVPQGDWEELIAGGVEKVSVGGNHFTAMNEPYVREVAAVIDEKISVDRHTK